LKTILRGIGFWAAAFVVVRIIGIGVVACSRDGPTIPKGSSLNLSGVYFQAPVEVITVAQPAPNTTYGVTYYVPALGVCGDSNYQFRVPLHHLEIWTGHPTRDGPVMELIDTVHVDNAGEYGRTRIVPVRDKFIRTRFIDIRGTVGCWTTDGEMYQNKEQEDEFRDRPN